MLRESATANRPYPRLKLWCQHHEGCGSKQQMRLGEGEPFAFLAVWHRKGSKLRSTAEAPVEASKLRQRHSDGTSAS